MQLTCRTLLRAKMVRGMAGRLLIPAVIAVWGLAGEAGAVTVIDTLRPTGAGGVTDHTANTGTNWDAVNDLTADNATTYVYTFDDGTYTDAYATTDVTGRTGAIDSVVVSIVAYNNAGSAQTGAAVIRLKGTNYTGTANALTGSWTRYNYKWTTCPATSAAWTWDSINTMQIGFQGVSTWGGEQAQCTQIFAQVYSQSTSPSHTWDGSNSALWSLAANWSNDTVPSANDTLIFYTGTPTYTATTSIASLAVSKIRLNNTGSTDISIGTNAFTIGSGGIDMTAATKSLSISSNLTLGAAQTWNVITGEALAVSGTIANSTYLLTIDGAGNTTISNVLGNGSGGVTKAGSGTLTVSATNTYTGATAVNAGVLNVQNAQGTGTTAGGVTVASGAALQLQGGITVGAEALNITGSGVSSDGVVRNISGDNTWQGQVNITTSATIQSDAGTLTLSGTQEDVSPPVTLTVQGAGNTTISGAVYIGASSAIVKDGTGTLTLSNSANNYTGTTTIKGGSLVCATNAPSGSAGALGNASSAVLLGHTTGSSDAGLYSNGAYTIARAVTVQSGNSGTITFGGTNTSGTATYSGAITLSKAASVSAASGGTVEVTSVISGSNALTKTGAGTVKFSGSSANTYSGTTTVNAGTLVLNKSAGVNAFAGAVTIGDGSGTDSLRVDASNQIPTQTVTTSGGVLAFGSGGSTEHTIVLEWSSYELWIDKLEYYNGSWNTVQETGSITYHGDWAWGVEAGACATNTKGTDTPGDSAIFTFTGTGIRWYCGWNSGLEVAKIYIDGTQVPESPVTANGTCVADYEKTGLSSGPVTDTIGALAMTAGGVYTGSGTLYLGGNVTTSSSASAATISGNLGLGGSNRTFTVADGAAATDLDVSAAISGSNAVEKAGAGLMLLSGTNTYSGTTTVSAGTLSLTGSVASNTSVSAGATLAGTGTVTGTLTLATGSPGGTLSPGTSATPATLTTSGVTTMNSGAVFSVDIAGNASNDKLSRSGANACDLASATLTLTLAYAPTVGHTYTIIENTHASGTISNQFSCGTSTTASYSGTTYNFTISYAGGTGNNDVVVTCVASGKKLYWNPVAGSANFNTAGNWTTDQGGTTPTGSRAKGDTLYFSGSGARGDTTCNMTANDTCNLLDFTGYTGTFNFGSYVLADSGSATFVAGMTVTEGTGTLAFVGTNSGKTFSPAGKTIKNLTINGSGGAWTVTSNGFKVSGTLTIAAGTLNLGTSLTDSAGTLSISAGVLDFQSSTLQTASTTVNLNSLTTLTANTGTLTLVNGSSQQTLTPKSGTTHPSITQNGAGGTTIASNDLSAGTVTISSGTFTVPSGRALSASGGIAVNSGGTLAGAGTISSAVTVASGGTISPGTSSTSATLAFSANITMASGAIYSAHINGDADNDKISWSGTGTLNLASATLTLTLGYGPSSAHTFRIIDNTSSGTISNQFASGTVADGSYSGTSYDFTVNYSGGTGNDVVLTPVAPDALVFRPMTVKSTATADTVYTSAWRLVFSEGSGGGIAWIADSNSTAATNEVPTGKNLFYIVYDGDTSYESNVSGTSTVLESDSVVTKVRQTVTLGQTQSRPFTIDYAVQGCGRIYVRAWTDGLVTANKTLRFLVTRQNSGTVRIRPKTGTASSCPYILLSDNASDKNDFIFAPFEDWSGTGTWAFDTSSTSPARAGWANTTYGLAASKRQAWEFLIDFGRSVQSDTSATSHNVATDYRTSDSLQFLAGYLSSERAWEMNLEGHWSFDENTGDTVRDVSRNNRAGAITNGTWSAGRFGYGLTCSGDDSVIVSDNDVFDATGDFTIMAWVKPATTVDNNELIIKKGSESAGTITGWKLDGSSGAPRFVIGNGSGAVTLTGPTSLGTGSWKHVAIRGSNTSDSITMFVDGKCEIYSTSAFSAGANTNPVVMGKGLDAVVDDVRYYNCAIPDAYIRAISLKGYNPGTGELMTRADDNNTLHLYCNTAASTRYFPVFKIYNYWSSDGTPNCVYINGTSLGAPPTRYVLNFSDNGNSLSLALDTTITASTRIFVDDDECSGVAAVNPVDSSNTTVATSGASDSLIYANCGSSFGASAGQFALVGDLNNGTTTQGNGAIDFYATSDVNASTAWRSATNLVYGSGLLNTMKWRYRSGAYDSSWGGDIGNTADIAPTVAESSSVRLKVTLDTVKVIRPAATYQDTVRPESDGSCAMSAVGDSPNYKTVDDVATDNDATYVYHDGAEGATLTDRYVTVNPPSRTGTIDSVTVFMRWRETSHEGGEWAAPLIYSGSTTSAPVRDSSTNTSYRNFTNKWSTDPNGSVAWTWSAVNAMQVGVQVKETNGATDVRVTQVYGVVYSRDPADTLFYIRQYTFYPDGKVYELLRVTKQTQDVDTLMPTTALATSANLSKYWGNTTEKRAAGLYRTSTGVHGMAFGCLGYESKNGTGVTAATLVTDTGAVSNANEKLVRFKLDTKRAASDSMFLTDSVPYQLVFFYDFSQDFQTNGNGILAAVQAVVNSSSALRMITGSLVTNDAGDLDDNGFNEAEGCWVVSASSNTVHFGINSAAYTRYNPVFKINNYTSVTKPQYVFLYRSGADTARLIEGYQYSLYHDKSNKRLLIQLDTTLATDSAFLYLAVDPTMAVTMDDFRASGGDGRDTVFWTTQSEEQNRGFILYRRIKPEYLDSLALAASKAVVPDSEADAVTLLYKRSRISHADTNWVPVFEKIIPGAPGGRSFGTRNYRVIDRYVRNDVAYQYRIESLDYENKKEAWHGIAEARPMTQLPGAFLLHRNYPNPFKAYTTIRYDLPVPSRVRINIYSMQGRVVRQLLRGDQRQNAGFHRVVWNGTDDFGRRLPPGPYIYQFVAGKYRKAMVMMVLR